MSIPIIGAWALKALGWRQQEKQQGGEEGRREGLARTEQRILVMRRHNLELLRLGVISEPSPPAALNAGGGRAHLLLERIDRAKVALKRRLQLAVFELATALLHRREVLPEQRMVDVPFRANVREDGCIKSVSRARKILLTSAIELERGLESDLVAGRRRLDVCLFGCVEAVHVGLVVLRVMKIHDFGSNVWL